MRDMSDPVAQPSKTWPQRRLAYKVAVLSLRAADQALNGLIKVAATDEAQQQLAQSAASRAIETQRQLVAITEQGRGKLLATCDDVEVYEWWINVPGGGGPAKGATAVVSRVGGLSTYNSVDVKVKKKGGLGGAAVGGALLGPAGAVIGFGLRRKTEVQTINTPYAVDTRQEFVHITGKGFSHTLEFYGWGEGKDIAKVISRQSAGTPSQKKALRERESKLDRLVKKQKELKNVGKRESAASSKLLEAAWKERDEAYRIARVRWKKYKKSRPNLLRHLAGSVVPGIEKGAFSLLALALSSTAVGLAVSAYLYSPHELLAGLSLSFSIGLAYRLVSLRGNPPRKRNRI
jgi:hypothetical protein